MLNMFVCQENYVANPLALHFVSELVFAPKRLAEVRHKVTNAPRLLMSCRPD